MTLTPRTTEQDRPARTVNSAIDDLHRQVADLLNPRRQRFNRSRLTPRGAWVDGGPVEHVVVPALWQQLRAALGTSRTLTSGGGRPGSKLPLDPGVHDVAAHITAAVNQHVLNLGLSLRLRQATTTATATRLQLLPAGRHDDPDRTPWHDPDRVGQLAERHAATRAAVTDGLNAARIVVDLPANLRQVAQAVVGTRDLEQIEKLAGQVHHWVRITESAVAMDEEGTETRGLRGFPCPDCRTAWTTRDQDGEQVREPAIVAVFRDHRVRNFTCRRCGALWWRGADIEALTASADRWRNPVHTHHAKLTIEHGAILAAATCSAVSGADCRLACPEGCETIPCGHKLHDAGTCGVVEFVNATGFLDAYVGDPEPARSGPVEIEWDGADYGWTYAEPAAVQAVTEDPSVQIAREAASA